MTVHYKPTYVSFFYLFQLFEELQLDSEWSLNAGNWLWVSCSAFFHGQIPWYCPVNVGKKLDPSGNFIRLTLLNILLIGNFTFCKGLAF